MNMMQSEVSEPQSSEIPPSSQGSWLALLTVAITAFALVTSEFLPIGVLNDISSDLHVSVGTAGLMITLPGIMAHSSTTPSGSSQKFRSALLTSVIVCNDGVCQCHHCNCINF